MKAKKKAKKKRNLKGVYQRGNKWWIRYRFEGRLVRKSISHDKRLAEEVLIAIKGDIVRGEYRLSRRNEDSRLFKEMFQEYMIEKTKRSLKRDEASFKNLLPEFQHKPLYAIMRQDIEAYVKKRRDQVSSARSIESSRF